MGSNDNALRMLDSCEYLDDEYASELRREVVQGQWIPYPDLNEGQKNHG